MMSRLDLDILINQTAQGIRTRATAWATLANLPESEIRDAVRRTAALAQQAGVRSTDVAEAISSSGVRPTRTAAVLLTKGDLGTQLAKIATLPWRELQDGFFLAITLLTIADKRRRETKCGAACAHWWHKDLSDEAALLRIRADEAE